MAKPLSLAPALVSLGLLSAAGILTLELQPVGEPVSATTTSSSQAFPTSTEGGSTSTSLSLPFANCGEGVRTLAASEMPWLVFTEGVSDENKVLVLGPGSAVTLEDATSPNATGSLLVHTTPSDQSVIVVRRLINLQELARYTVPGIVSDPSVSSDGRFVGYVLSSGTEQSIQVLDSTTNTTINVSAGREHLALASVSPDGTQISWLRSTSAGAAVVVADLDALVERTIARDVSTGLSWSPDSQFLAYAKNVAGFSRIAIARSTPGSQENILGVQAGNLDVDPAWRPDCTGVVFLRQVGGSGGVEIWQHRFAGGESLVHPGDGVRSFLSAADPASGA